ncbi:MAG: plasmid pRiA4b ORF-3 family protein [Candidatus Omnitrophica bacterium]|nr:plasmid pRiA4b ORF-3 family protein [Candidatus Omnitrophota bacterium]
MRRALSIASTHNEIKVMLNKPINIYRLKIELISMGCRNITREVSRGVDIDGKHTLYDLHMEIQDLFGWDNDHMFSFYLGEELYDRKNEYSANPLGEHMLTSWGPPSKPASETELRDLNLSEGFSFFYLFDYGDELIHRVTVENIREMTSKESSVVIHLDKIGIAPSQYAYDE